MGTMGTMGSMGTMGINRFIWDHNNHLHHIDNPLTHHLYERHGVPLPSHLSIYDKFLQSNLHLDQYPIQLLLSLPPLHRTICYFICRITIAQILYLLEVYT